MNPSLLKRNLGSIVLKIIALFSFQTLLPAMDVMPIAGWDQQLFPSYIITTASIKSNPEEDESENVIGDRRSMFGATVTADTDNQVIDITVSCDDFLESSTLTAVLPKAGISYSVMPKIRFRYDRLSQCKQATPAAVTCRINSKEGSQEFTETVTFRSINDCPLMFINGDTEVDTCFTFAAYVNEQHPYIDKMLREALDIGIVERFNGYQTDDPRDVIRQVYAIWDLLVARDNRYSSITTTAVDSNSICSQHVRMIEDTINNSQSNCVDGSVLLVTMLRKIGIDAFLILEPGHCYMGFYLDKNREKILCMETTLSDATIDEPEEVAELLDSSIDVDLRGEKSWPNFIASIGVATNKMNAMEEKYKDSSQKQYQIIDIAEARKMGVLPIPFRGSEEFVAYDHFVSTDSTEDEEMTEKSEVHGSDSSNDENSDEEDSDEEDSEDE